MGKTNKEKNPEKKEHWERRESRPNLSKIFPVELS
jgi:hypothetical protein